MASARPLAASLLLPLLTAVALSAPAQGLEVEHRGGGAAPFLPHFPPFAPSSQAHAQAQAFSGGMGSSSSASASASAFSKAFSDSFALGPAGARRLLLRHGAFSQSASNATHGAGEGVAGVAGAAASSSSESGSESSGQATHSRAFAGEGGLLAQGERVSESSSQSSSSSSSSSARVGGAFVSGASSEGVLTGQRVTHLAPVAEVPVLRPVVSIVEELVPAHLEDRLDAILLTTPVPIIEEVNVVPIHLQAGNQVTGHVASQENHQNAFHSSTSHLGDKHRKRVGPVRGYPSPSPELHHSVSSGSFESHNRGSQSAHSESSNSHRESSSHYSSTQHKGQPPLVLIGYQDNQQGSQYGSSEYHTGGSQSQEQRVRVGQADSIKNILDAMQSFMKGSSYADSHRESHREAQRTNAQDGGAHRITYEAVVTGEAPEVLYETQVNKENGIKESFQQSANSQGSTNSNNIISQITREAAELNKQQPYFVVNNGQTTSKFSETHGRLSPEQIHMRPHLENIDKVIHSEDSSQFTPHGSGSRAPVSSAGKRDDVDDSVSYTKSFHAESHSENSNGNNERLNSAGKFLMFNGRRYTSDDLAREFNRTRPTFSPPSPPTTPKPQIHQANQAEASTPSYGLQLHPSDKQNTHSHSSKDSSSSSKGVFTQYFGKHYHEFVPPALFDSREFSKFFFDHFRPGQPLPSAADFAQATANVPSSVPDRVFRPPDNKYPTNYFIYPGSIKHEIDIPDYVTRDMRNMKYGSSSSSSSSSSESSESSSSSESESISSSESESKSSSGSGSNFSSEFGSSSNSKSSTSKPRRPTSVQY